MTTPNLGFDLTPLTRTSPAGRPIDLTSPIPLTSLAGKTILITGGASGIGAAFAARWAAHGANIFVADINPVSGAAVVASLPTPLIDKQQKHHFIKCDVTVWDDQLRLFQEVVRLSPTGGIDAVVPNAGIYEKRSTATGRGFEDPVRLDQPGAPEPRLDVLKTNLIAVAWTVHLAMFWLPRNGPDGERDRHILLIGSIAGISPLPGLPEYCAAKHGVTGLWRALSGTGWRHGVRSNLLLPYFTDTPMMPWQGMGLLAGAGVAEVNDVVEAGTRMMADEGIRGKALAVTAPVGVEGGDGGDGTRVLAEGEEVKVVGTGKDGRGRREAVWEVMAGDYEHVEAFVWRFVRLMNALMVIRGWVGFLADCVRFGWFRRREEERATRERRRRRAKEGGKKKTL
ncbi:hypothetical protein GE09DRAFT_756003 [Coniochaeta sp. 2T2.1]|nr:hypothetical protein GE09DRAFT_756003 [Coniochaeta sp. 2T2.1]